MSPRFDTILITGAAGRLGTHLRSGLAPLARRLRVSDRVEIKDLRPNEEVVICDLSDFDAVLKLTEDVDAIVHFGGAALETNWQSILDSSIRGSYHIYEGARRNGVKRIVYASSVHAIGYHKIEDQIDADAPHRPDSLYGVSKCFVEDLSRLYWDKFGIETVCCRIFSSFDKFKDRRMLWSMLTFGDCVRLVEASLTAPRVAHSIIFGISNNRHRMVNNRLAGHIGFHPQDSTEAFRAEVEGRLPAAGPDEPAVRFLGGWFVDLGHPDDPDE
ncbi:NAD-dependent epimerase/dehydratase family protein [Bradyrhizobium genosp. P]|uniref:NAD-dependent epimerase/dehydratase family protein n=1 Tax=Bradyrhizobium genosp. P TaxID=83641 RepID=UPI003CE9F3CA